MKNVSHSTHGVQIDLDQLLQDSYLLVVELRQGGAVRNSESLWECCVKQIVYVRQQLEAAGVHLRSIDLISHAHCALLDETVLTCATAEARTKWASEPLQAKFFNHHQAGEFLYEEIGEALADASTDIRVLIVYHRILVLGFLGRYPNLTHPDRQQYLERLSAKVSPLMLEQGISTLIKTRDRTWVSYGFRSPWLHAAVVVALLVATWWGLDTLLAQSLMSLTSARV